MESLDTQCLHSFSKTVLEGAFVQYIVQTCLLKKNCKQSNISQIQGVDLWN